MKHGGMPHGCGEDDLLNAQTSSNLYVGNKYVGGGRECRRPYWSYSCAYFAVQALGAAFFFFLSYSICYFIGYDLYFMWCVRGVEVLVWLL